MKSGSGLPPTLVIGLVFVASVAVAVLLVFAGGGPRREASRARASASAPPGPRSGQPEVELTQRPEGPDDAAAPPPVSPSPAPPRDDGCPRDMVLVSGLACPYVAHKCKDKRKEVGRERGICDTYENEVLCEGRAQPVEVCMDRWEYPNRRGATPTVLLSFDEAERVCEAHDKRLCTVREWQFACEGEAITPFPVGLARERDLCVWDRGPVVEVVPTLGVDVALGVERSDRRAPSGSAERCVSAAGVADLTGNVREWVRDPEHGRLSPPFTSALAGGAWGSGAATCRTLDQEVPPPSRSASAGFRCCADAPPRADAAPRAEPRRGRGFRPILAQ